MLCGWYFSRGQFAEGRHMRNNSFFSGDNVTRRCPSKVNVNISYSLPFDLTGSVNYGIFCGATNTLAPLDGSKFSLGWFLIYGLWIYIYILMSVIGDMTVHTFSHTWHRLIIDDYQGQKICLFEWPNCSFDFPLYSGLCNDRKCSTWTIWLRDNYTTRWRPILIDRNYHSWKPSSSSSSPHMHIW